MKKLVKAWELRMDRELGECRQLFSEITALLQVDSTITEKSFAAFPLPEFLIHVDYTLLMASLKRADGQISESKNLIQLVEKVMQARNHPLPFQFYFQKGVTALLLEGDYSQGLDMFVKAGSLATSLMEKISAQSNTIYCLENLGMAFEGASAALEALLQEAKPNAFPDARAQFDALRMRQAFRNGFFDDAFKIKISEKVSQATHLRYWISELPFHRHYGEFSEAEKERYLTQSANRLQKAYHLRTFQGIVHPADLDSFRESDYCDRLYLWVWRWLADPNAFPLEKVLSLLQNTTIQTLSPRLTQEDLQMLRNSVLWISLFVPAQTLTLKKLAASLNREIQRRYSYFDFEEMGITYLSKLQAGEKEAQSILRKLQSHALWKSKDLYLPKLFSSVACSDGNDIPEILRPLSQRLRQICIGQKPVDKEKLYVDLLTYRVMWKGGKERIISENMCFALDLLYRKECVEFAEFGLVCFGLRQFDSFTHSAKVYNLLARLKACLPKSLSLKTKGGRIYAVGTWENVQFERPIGCEEVVQRQSEWRHLFVKELAARKAPEQRRPKPNFFLAEAPGKKILSRKELEALTGKSRSTASRLIAHWIEQGVVKRIGSAKNTKYLLLTMNRLTSFDS
jgi:hypothetical protein